MDTLRNALIFALMLGGLIAAHELGHLLAAVWCKVRVKEFGLGLPPRLLTLGEWRGMKITLNWIPLGGFVRPEGEFDPAVPNGLAAASAQARLAVFVAGPLANLMIGYLVFVIGFMTGWPDRVAVVATLPGYPAETAGLLPDDVILSANGKTIRYSNELTDAIYDNLDKPILLEVDRGGETTTLAMTPRTPATPSDRPAGINTTNVYVSQPIHIALARAGEQLINQVRETFALPLRLFVTHETKPEEVRFSGVVGLKQVSDRVVENSVRWQEWYPILHLTAVVSVALGITNLLPLPALDGGRIAFVLLELLRRKPMNAKRERTVHAAGMVVLLCLMVVLVVQDVVNPLF